MTSDESGLDQVFQSYRQACPDMEPSPHFMPALWGKIEARYSFPFLFRRWGRSMVTAAAALCLLLLAMNLAAPQTGISYPDALMAESSAEQTYFTEAIASTPPMPSEDAPSSPLR